MLADILGLVATLAPVIGLLLWREHVDRRAHEAGLVRAEVHAGATRALDGESLLGIDVRAPTVWRPGQVRLSTPKGYESLIGQTALAAVARAESACVRVAYLRSFPRPRVDRFDRVVVDTDREMARITHTTIETFAAAARRFDDVTMEVVVRFGRPRHEVAIESEVFAPDLVSVLAPREAGLVRRFATWMLRRRIARCAPVRVIVLETLRRHAGRWPWPDARSPWRDVVRT